MPHSTQEEKEVHLLLELDQVFRTMEVEAQEHRGQFGGLVEYSSKYPTS
jgi:hypothetical protein